jgi:hypothetical protein
MEVRKLGIVEEMPVERRKFCVQLGRGDCPVAKKERVNMDRVYQVCSEERGKRVR